MAGQGINSCQARLKIEVGVLEVELAEPSLFLTHAPGSAERLAAAIALRLLGRAMEDAEDIARTAEDATRTQDQEQCYRAMDYALSVAERSLRIYAATVRVRG